MGTVRRAVPSTTRHASAQRWRQEDSTQWHWELAKLYRVVVFLSIFGAIIDDTVEIIEVNEPEE
jgi:hypothetical protein